MERYTSRPATPREERAWLAAAAGGLVLLLVAFALYRFAPGLDAAATPAEPHGALLAAARALAAVGTTWPIAVATLVGAIVLFARGRPWGALRVVGIPYGTTLVTFILKEIVARPRPPLAFVGTSGHSFPSGHASSAAALACLLVWFAHRHVRRPAVLVTLLAVSASWAVIMAFDRILLRAHYFTDVLGGVGLGVALAGFGLVVSSRVQSFVQARRGRLNRP